MNCVEKKKVGNVIRNIRIEKGLTLEQFGKIFNASKGIVSRWENGISLPSVKRLKKLSEISGFSIDDILKGYEYSEIAEYFKREGITQKYLNYAERERVMIIMNKDMYELINSFEENINDIKNLLECALYVANEGGKSYAMDKIITLMKSELIIIELMNDDIEKVVKGKS